MNLGVSYIPAHLPQHLETDMKEMNRIGCNQVLYAMSENNIFILEGAWKYGPDLAKAHGLKPMAAVWGYANTFGGGRISRLMLDDTEMWARDRRGNLVPLACYNNPKIIARFLEIADRLYQAGFESIFIDEPTTQPCWCKHCQTKYRELYHAELGSDASRPEMQQFLRQNCIDYVAALCKGVKRMHRDMETMACLMPHDEAMWQQIVEIGELDNFGTDTYWFLKEANLTIDQSVEICTRCRSLATQHDKSSHIWLQGWFIPAGKEQELYEGGLRLAATGHDSFYTWSFMGALGTNEQSANPLLVWQSVSKLYRELSGK